MSPYEKNICSPIRFSEKSDILGKMCTKELGKFSLYGITHHARGGAPGGQGGHSAPPFFKQPKSAPFQY